MKRIYHVGNESNLIKIGLNMSTSGVAYTAVMLHRSGGSYSILLESSDPSGSIEEYEIGKATDMNNTYIIFRSLIEFSHIPMHDRAIHIENIRIAYRLSGGLSGNQFFNHDNDDLVVTPNNKGVMIIKAIQLI